MSGMATIDEIKDNFELLEQWDDRYRYVIELGRTLTRLPDADRSAANKVQGCASQVWLARKVSRSEQGEPVIDYVGDSDAHIVRGLIAILLSLYSGQTAKRILDIDAIKLFDELGFREHLSPQRSNGLRSMVKRVQSDAREALAMAS
jgi:cysteine desulfuration protein SufE